VLDIKITGGQVIHGTGAPARRADVGLTGDRVTAVGDLSTEPAGRTIDAAGRTVTPGFIDMHSHSDWRLWDNRRAESKIRQGVTTEVVGNCGFSPAPVSDAFRHEMKMTASRSTWSSSSATGRSAWPPWASRAVLPPRPSRPRWSA